MVVVPIACLKDNYSYLLVSDESADAIIVDPSEGAPIIDELERRGLTLSTILLTHHHWDHVGGIPALVGRYPQVTVYAHAVDGARVTTPTTAVTEGQKLSSPVGTIDVLHVPGHTLGAVAYVVNGAVFTGDTLFGGGCGRLFEGTGAQMHASLQRLATLPRDYKVYSGHEYTLQNLAFAVVVEPNNADIKERIERVNQLRASGTPSVPSTVSEELLTNPFLRCDEAGFIALRKQKDDFRA
jgi:hydroxyacylglutathione hydrolase